MRVCLDGRSAGIAAGTGVTTYARVLGAALPAAGCEMEVLAEGAATGLPRRWAAAALGGSVAAPLAAGVRAAGDAYRVAQVRFDLGRRFLGVADADPPDVMHWTYPMPLRFVGVPNVYTVHDLIPLLHPGLTPVSGRRMGRLLRRLRREAAHLVTVSEASRAEIVSVLGWDPARVTNTYQAVMPGSPTASEVAAALGPLGLERGTYWLHVGTVEPRKNVGRLIAAHAACGVRGALVLVGPDGWRAEAELAGAAGRAGLVRVPWVERGVLSALIAGARAVVAPSLAEGFGLAVAEGMALGTPVLTSDAGATAEVAGGAAALVDPLDVGAIAAGMLALDGDVALRERLAGEGRRRAGLFGVEAYAGRLRALYGRVVGV